MPWKSKGGQDFEFSGEIVVWIEEMKKWYEADADVKRLTSMDTYFVYATTLFATLAKEKWSAEFFGKGKVKKLDSFVSTTPDGKFNLQLWNTVDFLAMNLDRDFLRENTAKVKETLGRWF